MIFVVLVLMFADLLLITCVRVSAQKKLQKLIFSVENWFNLFALILPRISPHDLMLPSFLQPSLAQKPIAEIGFQKNTLFTKFFDFLTFWTAPQILRVSPFLACISAADGHLQVRFYLKTKFRNRFWIKTDFTKNCLHFSPLCVSHPASPSSVSLPSMSHSSLSCFYTIFY